MGIQINNRQSERGNVLFLILIAVALFAALSYAVTQSTRSGSGTADAEQALLSSASMTQHPTALRTAIIRMVLGGTDISNIYFNAPANFAALSDVGTGVFHPRGGGAVFQQAPADVMANASQGTWYYNALWDVPFIGIDDNSDGNDLVAFLPGINRAVCRSINEELGINTAGCTSTDNIIPDLIAAADEGNLRINYEDRSGGADTFPTGDQDDIESAGCNAFHGQPSGCFFDPDTGPNGEYVFYSVLLER